MKPLQLFAKDLFKDKVAVITGASTGIGKGLALAFAELGADVVLASRREELLKDVAKQVEAFGRKALVVPTNVREPEDVVKLRDRVRDELERVDFLVNNAGVHFMSPALQMTAPGWKSVVDVVLNGTFYGCRFFGEWMISQRHGRIINMAGTNGLHGSPLMCHTGAAKAGVINLTRTLAAEWAPFGVLVNAVAPGPVDTEGAKHGLWGEPKAMETVRKAVPVGRLGKVEDCVPAVLYLCSAAGDFITGEVISVDGGNSLRQLPDWF